MKKEESPELEEYFNLCRRIYECKVADGTEDRDIAKLWKEREKFDSSQGSKS